MILDLDYRSGHGHMTVDLEKFLPATLAQWRKLVRVMADSYPDPREDVKAYLYKRYEDAKWDIKVLDGTVTAARMMADLAAYDKMAEAKKARAKIRSAEAQIRALQKYIDKYPDYMRLLTQ